MSTSSIVPKPALREIVRPTTLIEAPRLKTGVGVDVVIASETFQYTGSFKFRAAYNQAANVPHNMMITASSGNFGQALAYACSLLNKKCIVVMPDNSARVKVEAVAEYGGIVELVNTKAKSRKERVDELARQYPEAYVASAYDDPLVIEGNATLGAEIAELANPVDVVVAPVGGGGLTGGIVKGIRSGARADIKVVGAEPIIANDASRSLKAGQLVAFENEPQTIADGVRTLSLGKSNWEILQNGLETIVEVPEEKIIEAVNLLFFYANLKCEPTGALGLAAVLTQPEIFINRRTCVVVSGGNVDLSVLQGILTS